MLNAAIAGAKEGVTAGLKAAVPGIVDTLIDGYMSHPAYPVIVGGQVRLIQAGMAAKEAWETSRRAVAEFCKDEGVTVGHPDYDWSPSGGATIVEQFEIEHWETAQAGEAE